MLHALLLVPYVLAPGSARAFKVDGFFEEWAERPSLAVTHTVEGLRPSPTDLDVNLQVAWGDDRLFVAVQVVDDKLLPGTRTAGERLELGFGDTRLQVVLGDLESRPPQVFAGKRRLKGAKTFGTTRTDGWAVELSLPLKALPDLQKAPVPFAVTVYDADADATHPDAIVSTPPGDTIHLDSAAGLLEMYRRDRGGEIHALASLRTNFAGGPLEEEIVITPTDIVLMGHGLPIEAAYVYFTHGWREDVEVVEARLLQADGKGLPELLVRHTEWAVPEEVQVEILELYGFRSGYLMRMFSGKIAERFVKLGGEARSEYQIGPRLKIKAAKLTGALNPGSYVDVDKEAELQCEPMVLPWVEPKGATYALEGDFYQRR